MEEGKVRTLLLVDDDPASLDLYAELLSTRLDLKLKTAGYPTQGLSLANEHLYDIILVDVTMNYLGSQFGGLDLYKQLLPRYGASSLLAYSQYITDDLLKAYNYNFNFIERPGNVPAFIDAVGDRIRDLRAGQTCFVAMPFDGQYDDLFSVIEESVAFAGYRCIRVDNQVFTKSIVEMIVEGITKAKLVIFVAEDRNPNAFYECGYAVALGKEVITITEDHADLPFDIRDRNAIAYGGDLDRLRVELGSRLSLLSADWQ